MKNNIITFMKYNITYNLIAISKFGCSQLAQLSDVEVPGNFQEKMANWMENLRNLNKTIDRPLIKFSRIVERFNIGDLHFIFNFPFERSARRESICIILVARAGR